MSPNDNHPTSRPADDDRAAALRRRIAELAGIPAAPVSTLARRGVTHVKVCSPLRAGALAFPHRP